MNKIRQRRLIWILSFVAAIAVASGLVLYALKQNINLFFTPSQVTNGEVKVGSVVRLGGMVKAGSVQHVANSLRVKFTITDLVEAVEVNYDGVLPNLFREGQGVVVQGRLDPKGKFKASQVLAKHDENYMPPPVAKALKQQAEGMQKS